MQETKTKTELLLDEDTVKNNFDVIRHLQPFEKLTIDRKGKMTVDRRYLQCVRRALTWDCKYDILVPLERTFDLIKGESEDEKVNVLNTFSASVKQTYPQFDDLHKLIAKLLKACKETSKASNNKSNDSPINIELDLENAKEYNSTPTTPPPVPHAPPVPPPAPANPSSGCGLDKGVSGKTSFRDALLNSSPQPQSQQGAGQPPIVPPSAQKTSDMTAPTHMSAEMCEFLNISQKTKLSRKEIQVMMNAYIVNKKCLDMDTKMITPDEKLSRLLGCKSKIPLTNFKSFYERHILQ